MKRFNVLIVVLSLLGTFFLTSCEQAENQIIGLWVHESRQKTAYEDGELTATASDYYIDDDAPHWEFQDRNFCSIRVKKWNWNKHIRAIENGEELILSRENNDDLDMEINSLTRKALVLMEVQYRTNGNILTVEEIVYMFKRVED